MNHPIFLGDPTTGGGRVESCQLEATHNCEGRPIAVLGDMASCAKHRGTFAFVEGDPRRRLQGKAMVLEGHRLSCGCHALSTRRDIEVE